MGLGERFLGVMHGLKMHEFPELEKNNRVLSIWRSLCKIGALFWVEVLYERVQRPNKVPRSKTNPTILHSDRQIGSARLLLSFITVTY